MYFELYYVLVTCQTPTAGVSLSMAQAKCEACAGSEVSSLRTRRPPSADCVSYSKFIVYKYIREIIFTFGQTAQDY